MRQTLFLAILVLGATTAVGQTPRPRLERGKIEELKGLTRLFVSTPGRDRSLASKVTSTIQDRLPGLTLVASPVDAQIWLMVYAGTKSETTRTPPDLNVPPNAYGNGQTRLSSESEPAVRGMVTIQGTRTRRVVMELSRTGGGKTRMAEELAKDFIRTYQKANGKP